MVDRKFRDLDDLNKEAYDWCEKVNSKIHSTTNEIPKVGFKLEKLNPISRIYIIDKTSVRKVEKIV